MDGENQINKSSEINGCNEENIHSFFTVVRKDLSQIPERGCLLNRLDFVYKPYHVSNHFRIERSSCVCGYALRVGSLKMSAQK